jgi:hypothetical protein
VVCPQAKSKPAFQFDHEKPMRIALLPLAATNQVSVASQHNKPWNDPSTIML